VDDVVVRPRVPELDVSDRTRPIEPSDWPAVHRLATDPAVARWIGATPYDGEPAWERFTADTSGGKLHRFGQLAPLADGDRLDVVGTITPHPRPRFSTVANCSVIARSDPSAMIARLVDLADRWLPSIKLEANVHADDPWRGAWEAHGFVPEVTRRRWSRRDGALHDGVLLGRVKPGLVTTAPGAPPPWPARGGTDGAIVVRPARPSDWDAVARTMRDDSVVWGTGQLPSLSVAHWASVRGNDGPGAYSLIAEVDGRIAGNGGIHVDAHPDGHRGWLGVTVASEWQGRGVGTALMREIVELAFTWLRLSRLELEVWTHNTRAVALYRKLGFETEGIRRLNGICDGGIADSYVMAIVR
jgi:putative acetyltransferase